MRKLLNTLFVTTENAYCSLDGENIVVSDGKLELGRFPLHILEAIYIFSYKGASPALMGKCAVSNINLVLMSPQGKFLCRVVGESNGNVLLRREQYRTADTPDKSIPIIKNFVFAKINNERCVLERAIRNHGTRLDVSSLEEIIITLKDLQNRVLEAENVDEIRGMEGVAAAKYFSRFNDLILQQEEAFSFNGRSRRPPMDRINALMSFAYVLLANQCAAGLEMVGLDSYVGLMHTDRSGRQSLALDLMEEFRAVYADRFVLNLVNLKIVNKDDFEIQENGAAIISPNARKNVQKAWHDYITEEIEHPYIGVKLQRGLIPYAQSLLLARCIRGDLDEYPPYLMR